MKSSMRFPTILLATGAAVLLIAVAVGRAHGRPRHRSGHGAARCQSVNPQAVTPAPAASPQPYGPDWKRSQALSAAGDPHFPDPRVPPQPLPTRLRRRSRVQRRCRRPTPNPNIPIWRQSPLPTVAPIAAGRRRITAQPAERQRLAGRFQPRSAVTERSQCSHWKRLL